MHDIGRLIHVMARLRDPEGGCPWDLEQDFSTIAPYTVEEAFEVAEAIARGHMDDLRDELGDLLFQVAFHSRMAEEAGHFDFGDVVDTICNKMERRHPHVFSDEDVASAEEQTERWEEHKARERAARSESGQASALDRVLPGLPALVRAQKLGKAAAKVGFDWPDVGGVKAKIDEEMGELEAELDAGDRQALHEEVGDLLFSVVNLCRHLDLDAEGALRDANAKFERRFRHVETALAAEGKAPADVDLDALETLWQAAKPGRSPVE